MEWYWWVLIVAGVAAVAFVKVKVGGTFMRRLQQDREAARRRFEEDG
jgi:hypothetical protein